MRAEESVDGDGMDNERGERGIPVKRGGRRMNVM